MSPPNHNPKPAKSLATKTGHLYLLRTVPNQPEMEETPRSEERQFGAEASTLPFKTDFGQRGGLAAGKTISGNPLFTVGRIFNDGRRTSALLC
jgi:hypothetical protein